MKNRIVNNLLVFFLMLTLFSSCQVIGDIFEAGLWVGVILVVLVIAFVIWLVKKLLG